MFSALYYSQLFTSCIFEPYSSTFVLRITFFQMTAYRTRCRLVKVNLCQDPNKESYMIRQQYRIQRA